MAAEKIHVGVTSGAFAGSCCIFIALLENFNTCWIHPRDGAHSFSVLGLALHTRAVSKGGSDTNYWNRYPGLSSQRYAMA